MLTAIAGQGSTDGAAAAASHLPDCKTHRDTSPLPLCLSLCICNSAFLWAFIERVTDAVRLRRTTNKSQIRNALLSTGNPRRASPKSIPWACQYGLWFKAIQYAWLPKGSTPRRDKEYLNATQQQTLLDWIAVPVGSTFDLGSALSGRERAQVVVREQPGSRGDGNNVRRAERGKTFLVKLLVLGLRKKLGKVSLGAQFIQ